ncbi:hypothetical protein [Shimia sp. NS0008-38b]|uniref:hypothetical protein n=1 Tax=Shimia sp. NS0008-38b TaxID=3127653 RepID=UPI003341B8CB
MRKTTSAALVALMAGCMSIAHADTVTFGEVGMRVETRSLSRDALNASVGSTFEPEAFQASKLAGHFGVATGTGLTWALQGCTLRRLCQRSPMGLKPMKVSTMPRS